MKTMRLATIPLSFFLLAALATVAGAGNPASQVSHLWLQGQDLDTAYESVDGSEREIRVQVWHDKDDEDTYRRGEEMQVHVRTNTDLYVVVYRLDADGAVEILWPTSRMDDGFVYGNHTYTLPRPGSPVRLTASQVKGVEYVQAIASEYPFDLRELGIDFRFDLDDRGVYQYAVSGDPFLAVNDINFAITGLEEDQDYIVTDWAHLYVDSKVEYARYTCRQCHDGAEKEYHPYVDSCTTVNVYNDWGWHRNWYVRFGYYPLFYEPGYYYWDVGFSRPYWNPYYPIVYSWPSYNCYTRPYPVYGWYNSPYWQGDYRVRYKRGVRGYSPLYDVTRPSVRDRLRDYDTRVRDGRAGPRSVRESVVRGSGDRRNVDRNSLVRDTRIPTRDRGTLTTPTRTVRGADRGTRVATPGRGNLRTDARRNNSERIRSLQPVDGGRGRGGANDRSTVRNPRGETKRSGDRRWTRPVIRNVDPDRGNGGTRGTKESTRGTKRPTIRRSDGDSRGSTIDRNRDTRKGRDDSGTRVQRPSKPRSGSRSGDAKATPRRGERKSEGKTVDRPRSQRGKKEGGGTPQVQRSRRSSSRSSSSSVQPQRRSNSGRKSSSSVTPQRRSSSRKSSSSVTPQRRSSSRKSSSSVKPQRQSSSRKNSSSVKPQKRSAPSRKSSGNVKSSGRSGSSSKSSGSTRGSSRGSSGRSGSSRSKGGRG